MWKELKGRLCRLSARVVGDQKGLLSDVALAADLKAQAQKHYEDGQLEKAVALMERALQILTRSLGSQHPDTVKANEALSALYEEFEAAS